jgi:SRSO17 transposase
LGDWASRTTVRWWSGSRWSTIEWLAGEKEPIKYWLSTVSERVGLDELVRLVKMRWRIERDYQEMKDDSH